MTTTFQKTIVANGTSYEADFTVEDQTVTITLPGSAPVVFHNKKSEKLTFGDTTVNVLPTIWKQGGIDKLNVQFAAPLFDQSFQQPLNDQAAVAA